MILALDARALPDERMVAALDRSVGVTAVTKASIDLRKQEPTESRGIDFRRVFEPAPATQYPL
jgi:hypothetical protein